MKHLLVLALLLNLTPKAEAHEAVPDLSTCESLLHSEFSRRPDDLRNGLITQNIPLSVSALVRAYSQGIFPWGVNAQGFGRWHRPPYRGILDLNEVHIGRSDLKYIRQASESGELRVTFNKDFNQVIQRCATVPRYRNDPATGVKIPDGAWITREFMNSYKMLHSLGFAHSVEVWRGDKLVAGLYGVFVQGVFTGESMFFDEPNATKLAFYALIENLRAGGHDFIDTQMVLGLALKWGAKYVHRSEYELLLREAQIANRPFFSAGA